MEKLEIHYNYERKDNFLSGMLLKEDVVKLLEELELKLINETR